jgi:hypothetical protein
MSALWRLLLVVIMQYSVSMCGASRTDRAHAGSARDEDRPCGGFRNPLIASEGMCSWCGEDSPVAENRRLLQVLSPWSHGITLPFLEYVEFVNSAADDGRSGP